MADVKWIKITTDMFDDEKIDFIQSLPEADAITVVWVRLLTLAGKCNAGGYIYLTENIPYEPEMLAHKFRKPISTLNLALETFRRLGMTEQTENGIYISNWEKHQNIDGLEKIREQSKKRMKRYREKLKLSECNVTSNVTVTDGYETELELELDKDKDIYSSSEDEQSEFLWKMYPLKAGKGKVIKKLPKLIKQYSYEQMIRTIERYNVFVAKQRIEFKELKYQNGSTFFNSGYVDFLDENYLEEPKVEPKAWGGVRFDE